MRDLDDAFNESELQKIEQSAKSKNDLIGSVILIILYSVASSLVWAMFFYRGGPAEMGIQGYFGDLIVIFYFMYVTSKDKKDRNLQILFGTIILIFIDVLLKSLVLYPAFAHLLS